MKTLNLKKIGENYEIEILPWMFGWYSQQIPPFEYLKQRLSEHFIPDQLISQVLEILEQMAKTGYKTGRLIGECTCKYLGSDIKKVGDNLLLTNPNYQYQRQEFPGLIGVISVYSETFNAGCGRVTAGCYDSDYYEITGIVNIRWCTNP